MSKMDDLRLLRERKFGDKKPVAPSPARMPTPRRTAGRGRPKGQETVPLPVRIAPDLLKRLDARAGKLGCTRSETIRKLLEEALAK